MLNDYCYSTYTRFNTLSRDIGAAVMGADNLVGDVYTIEPELQEDRSYRLWIVNRFGKKVAFLDRSEEQRILSLQARGWKLRALLSFVALDQGEKGYWGEVVLLCNDSHYNEAFDAFAGNLGNLMAQGVRPDVDFTEQAAREIVSSNGTWLPKGRVGKPALDKNSVLVKTRQSASEKLVEAGRQRKTGCFAASAVIWIVVIAALCVGVAKLLGFL